MFPNGIMSNELARLASGFYFAENAEGEDCFVEREVGHGWNVWTPSQGEWYQVVEYDENGNQVSVTYKK